MLNLKLIEANILKKLENESEESFSIWYKDLMREKQANKKRHLKKVKTSKSDQHKTLIINEIRK